MEWSWTTAFIRDRMLASLRSVRQRVEDPGEVRGQRQKKEVLVSMGLMCAFRFHSPLSHSVIKWLDDFNLLA